MGRKIETKWAQSHAGRGGGWREGVKALRDGMDLVFVSKLTYCLSLPDSPNLEGLLHMLAGLMQH